MKALRNLFETQQLENFYILEDFTNGGPDVTNKWELASTGSAGTAVISAVGGNGGVLVLTPDASAGANDEVYFYERNPLFLPLAGQPVLARGSIQFTETNVNQANIFFGLASGVGPGLMLTASGGMRATGTILGLYKQGGQLNWSAIARNGTNLQTTLSNLPAALSEYSVISVEMMDQLAGSATYSFRVNDTFLTDVNGNLIKFIVPFSGLTTCSLVAGVRNGATVTAGSEVLNIDWLYAQQRRNLGNQYST